AGPDRAHADLMGRLRAAGWDPLRDARAAGTAHGRVRGVLGALLPHARPGLLQDPLLASTHRLLRTPRGVAFRLAVARPLDPGSRGLVPASDVSLPGTQGRSALPHVPGRGESAESGRAARGDARDRGCGRLSPDARRRRSATGEEAARRLPRQ